ncbi:hypothetical protein BGX27_008709 [Mortierella sp. AM989]|nr:hypothetical protein BGX27_008709 [Mortierella sp. AM989]
MSLLPPQSSEDQEIYVAIPPPLVPPLARQLGSSHDSGSTHLPTPISTNNSSVSQSYAQWILDNQFQRATLQGLNGHGNASVSGLGTRTNLESSSETHSRPSGESSSNTQSNSRSPISPVSPTLPSQLLNRLYSFSTVMNPSQSDVSCTSSQLGTTSRSGGAGTSLGITSASFFTTNPIFGSSNNNNNNNGNGSSSSNNHNGSNSRSFLQYPSLGHSPELLRGGSTSFTTESTREAAATAIVNTLNRGEVRPSRGESPYIPSSLSMLFSDPEVMQLQEEVERAQMYQHQQRMRQRYLDSRRSFSGDAGLSNINTIEQPATIGEEDDDVDLIDDDEDGDDDNDLVNREDQQLLGSAQREMHYGYELVQDEQQEDDVYHPYATCPL